MSYPQIYIGQMPSQLERRRAIRTLAMDLRLHLRPQRESAPVLVLLQTAVVGAGIIDLIVMRPNTIIVAAIRHYEDPIIVESGAAWQNAEGLAIYDGLGISPLAWIGMQRDTLRARLHETLDNDLPEVRALERAIAAVICSPTLPAESRILLDIEDHRALRKILGMDELAGLASMASARVRIPETGMLHLIETLGGRLWHDGGRFLFELNPLNLRLRLLSSDNSSRTTLPLIEGDNIIGRRRNARPHEHRVTIAGDDLISSDHATLICQEDGQIMLRDSSKNGTWITPLGGEESFVHLSERIVIPDTILRMGDTRMRIEAFE